ncbi:MAG: replicative DNA helicase [Candidatus Taylorbacteria bacterium]|nr:replicative DNA helicase [Candidatus Taylorbacteria bacterium]
MSQTITLNGIRIPPQSLDAEKALLGSVMMRQEVLYEVMDFINPDVFYSDAHRTIWNAILELWNKQTAVDILSLSTKLKELNVLEQIGGMSYLTEIINVVPSASNAKHYAEIVSKKHMLRNLISAADHIAELGWNEAGDIAEILDKAEKKVFEVTNWNGNSKFIAIKDTLEDAWERLQKSGSEMHGVPTGFKELDNKLAGFQKSDLIILAARPSMGKTSLALDFIRKAAINHKVPVGFFSLEMSAQQLVDRMLSAESQVDAWKIRTRQGLNLENDFKPIQDALGRLSEAPIYIDDQPGNNILKMRSVARRLKSEKGLGLIVVDYLQLMVPTQSRNSDNVVQQVTEISHSLKNLARELEVPVVALSQLNRAVEARGGEPRLSDLRDSGSIEQDADVVMFIHREDKYNKDSTRPNIAKIMIEKHRNGPTGVAELYFDEKHTTFMDIEKSDFGEFDTSGM